MKYFRDNTEDSTGATDYPSKAAVFLQWAASEAAFILNSNYFFKRLPGRTQGSINGKPGSSNVIFYGK